VGGPPAGLPGVGGLAHAISAEAVQLFFGGLVHFVAQLDASTVGRLWRAVSASTAPVLSGASWHRELETMSVLGAELMLPLLFVAVLQAIARQDAGGLARTAFLKVPLALLFTAVAAEIVSLGLQATDEACVSLLGTASRPLHGLFAHLEASLGTQAAGLGPSFLFLLLAGVLALVVWLELAVRSAAVAVAVLFLPLALAGSALPATSHWARRLGETLAALVLSKLAIVAVLTLAVGALGDERGGLAALTEAIALLGLAAVAPLGLARLLPVVEGGAIAHLEGAGRRAATAAVSLAGGGPASWVPAAARSVGSRPTGSPIASSPPSFPPPRPSMPSPPPAAPPSEP
jgi:hypothetical protein